MIIFFLISGFKSDLNILYSNIIGHISQSENTGKQIKGYLVAPFGKQTCLTSGYLHKIIKYVKKTVIMTQNEGFSVAQ